MGVCVFTEINLNQNVFKCFLEDVANLTCMRIMLSLSLLFVLDKRMDIDVS